MAREFKLPARRQIPGITKPKPQPEPEPAPSKTRRFLGRPASPKTKNVPTEVRRKGRGRPPKSQSAPRNPIPEPATIKRGGRPRKDQQSDFNIQLYYKAGATKIAEQLEMAGCRVEEQGEELFLVFPGRGAPLCHANPLSITLRKPWQTALQKETPVKATCDQCGYVDCVWGAIHELVQFGRRV